MNEAESDDSTEYSEGQVDDVGVCIEDSFQLDPQWTTLWFQCNPTL